MKDFVYTLLFLIVVALIIGGMVGIYKVLQQDTLDRKKNSSKKTLIILFAIVCVFIFVSFLAILGKK